MLRTADYTLIFAGLEPCQCTDTYLTIPRMMTPVSELSADDSHQLVWLWVSHWHANLPTAAGAAGEETGRRARLYRDVVFGLGACRTLRYERGAA